MTGLFSLLAEGKAEMELSLWTADCWFGAFAESFFRETCRFSADMKQNDIPLAHILLSIYSKWKKVDIGGRLWKKI